jgi:hypothetical protein
LQVVSPMSKGTCSISFKASWHFNQYCKFNR